MPQHNHEAHPRNVRAVKVNIALMRFHRRAREVQELREELHAEETSYYQALANRLAPYVAHLSHETVPTPSNADAVDSETLSIHARHMQEMMRHMYVSLARHHHPDRQGQQTTRIMQQINDAYAEQALGTLMVLYQDTMPVDVTMNMSDDDMQHYLERINALCAQLDEEHQNLLASDGYALKQRLLQARLEGHNMIEEVAESLKRIYSASM